MTWSNLSCHHLWSYDFIVRSKCVHYYYYHYHHYYYYHLSTGTKSKPLGASQLPWPLIPGGFYTWQISPFVVHITVCVGTDELSKNATTLFDDVVDEFCEVDLIRGRFETWKKDYSDSYNEAFIGLCLPKLFTPFVKLELVCWNPLEVRRLLF